MSSREVTHLRSNYDKNEVLLDIKHYLNEGKDHYEITDLIYKKYPALEMEDEGSKSRITNLIRESKEIIFHELELNIEDVMVKHAALYDRIYQRHRTPRTREGHKITDRNVIVGRYLIAMDALRRKEKLLGLTGNKMEVQLKQETTIDDLVEEDSLQPKDLNLTMLSIDEKKELLFLLKKAKGDYEEQTKVTTTVTITNNVEQQEEEPKYDPNVVDQFEVEDVSYEEVEDHPEKKHSLEVAESIREMNKKEAEKLDKKLFKQKLKEKLKKAKK